MMIDCTPCVRTTVLHEGHITHVAFHEGRRAGHSPRHAVVRLSSTTTFFARIDEHVGHMAADEPAPPVTRIVMKPPIAPVRAGNLCSSTFFRGFKRLMICSSFTCITRCKLR